MKGQAVLAILFSASLLVVGCGDDKPPAEAGAGNSSGGSVAAGAGGSSGSMGVAGSGQSGAGSGSLGGGSSGNGGTGVGAAGTGGTVPDGDFPALNLMDDARKLSDGDKGLLCDWVNKKLGGYGLTTQCDGGTSSNDRDQAECVATRFRYNCKVTVQAVKSCTLVSAPSHACNTDFQECHPLYCIQ